MAAETQAACLYQETRLNLDPALPESVVDVLVPVHNASFASRLSPKRRRLDSSVHSYDEKSFSDSHLATESSIYFRTSNGHTKTRPRPNAILWRILDDRKLLELQAVDLCQSATEKNEPLVTLRFSFSNPIRPAGVQITEEGKDGDDTLVIFVLTTSGELCTLSLHRNCFEKPGNAKSLEETPNEWFRSSTPAPFSYRVPYRLLAKDGRQIWASLSDGALVKLERKEDDSWKESYFTEGGWSSSLRNILPWRSHSTVRFAGEDLMSTSAISMVLSPDRTFIWTVCLDHTLKVWNVITGKIMQTLDLSGDPDRDFQREPESLIEPSHLHLLRLVQGKRDGEYTLITFSPKNHDFRFWSVVHNESEPVLSIENIRDDFSFVAPIEDLADATMWRLEDFHVSSSPRKHHEFTIWMLVRFGTRCKTYKTSFNLDSSSKSLMTSWKNNWSCVDPGPYTTDALKHNTHNPSEAGIGAFRSEPAGAVEKWTDFIFYPGRFTSATLETALVVYKSSVGLASLNLKSKSSSSATTLKHRVSKVVGASCSLTRASDSRLAYDKYEFDIATQWQLFYGVVRDLQKRREEVLALAYDSEEDMPWLVMADQVSAVRSCNELEILWLNRQKFAEPSKLNANNLLLQSLSEANHAPMGQLFKAISSFRHSLSKNVIRSFEAAVKAELFTAYEAGTEQSRILELYDRVDLADHVTDEDYNELTGALEQLGGFSALSSEALLAPLTLLEEAQHGQHHKKHLARYGARALVRGAQGTVQNATEILMDLLLLVVFLAAEWEQSGYPRDFQVGHVFNQLITKLRHLALLDWLASTVHAEPVPRRESQQTAKDAGAELTTAKSLKATPITLLESLFIGDWSTMASPKTGSLSHLLTYWIRAWVFGAQLDSQYDNVVAYIFSMLIKKNEFQLAIDFVKFVPEGPWVNYLRGRLYLGLGEDLEAASCFQNAAHGLSTNFDLKGVDSAQIISLHDREYFNEGLAKYYSHVASFFEKKRIFSYTGEFLRMGLDALQQEDEADAGLKSDLLSHSFNAALHTSRFETAFAALNQFADMALRRSAIQNLLQALLSHSRVDLLLSMPFSPELAIEVDSHVASLVLKAPASGVMSTGSDATSYHKILYAFRLQRNDLRGAATCLWERLQILKAAQQAGLLGSDGDEEIAETYLTLLNTLSLVDPEQAWILTRPIQQSKATELIGISQDVPDLSKLGKLGEEVAAAAQEAVPKRKVITLADIRSMFQEELDRIADVEAGRFPLTSMDMGDLESNGAMQIDVLTT